jgi:AcrR family transcriptional regulator
MKCRAILGGSSGRTYDASVAFSAQGSRLNRRGLETRRQILDVAERVLAEGGPDALSANRIAREAGVTWGTIQHQFGESDGLWAAVLDRLADDLTVRLPVASRRQTSLAGRVRAIVETLFAEHDTVNGRAVQTLRMSLPRDPTVLARDFPSSAKALRRCDDAWVAMVDELLLGLVPSKAKVRRVRVLIPVAVHGIHFNAHLSTLIDAEEARSALVETVVAYLAD